MNGDTCVASSERMHLVDQRIIYSECEHFYLDGTSPEISLLVRSTLTLAIIHNGRLSRNKNTLPLIARTRFYLTPDKSQIIVQ